MNRRQFIKTGAGSSIAFLGLQKYLSAGEKLRIIEPYGPLIADPKKLLDLPKGFQYQVISRLGDIMSDGFRCPGRPDGMAAFPGKDGRVILVRNHELQPDWQQYSPFHKEKPINQSVYEHAYDPGVSGSSKPHLGGTTNIVYNPKTKQVEKQFLSLTGTDRNCAGGAMPWGSWITCEEPADLVSSRGQKHGYCFEVKATDDGKLQKAVPLKALGRYRHEAVALDPRTGILYLTEDIGDGLFYRFLPEKNNDFSRGTLQALAIQDQPSADLRNYKTERITEGQSHQVKWITMKDIDSPLNDLRHRGHRAGAARFARGEGIIFSDGHLYICCTDGGPRRQGQVMKLTPSTNDQEKDRIQLFLQPKDSDLLTNGDNICVSPHGDLIICEDLVSEHRSKRSHVRGVTPSGQIYTLARNAKNASEFAGSCFSPDGSIMFVNMQGLDLTLAITGPWKK